MQFFRYLLYPSQLYMFRMLRPSILRSTVMYKREGRVYVRCNNICQVSKMLCRMRRSRILQSMQHTQGDTKEGELLKNPTKIEEIQEKKIIDRN